jgi:hypothetical protein
MGGYPGDGPAGWEKVAERLIVGCPSEGMFNGSISPCLDKHCPVAPFDLSAQQVFLTPAGLCKNLTKTSIKLIYELPIQ